MLHTHKTNFHGEPLDEARLRELAPSIFAASPAPGCSDRFRPICTWDVVQGLAKEGFLPVEASQSRTRLTERAPFTKHLLRFRQFSDEGFSVGDVIPETVLKNGNDGSSAYDLMAGLFRIACLNGNVTVISDLGECRVRHTGNVVERVIEGTYTVIAESKRMLGAVEAWSGVSLDRDEQLALAEASHAVRWPADEEGKPTTAIEPVQLLDIRRAEDRPADLWTVYNRIQENAMRGGLESSRILDNGNVRRSRSRAIKGVDSTVALNRALFTLANALGEHKGVKLAA